MPELTMVEMITLRRLRDGECLMQVCADWAERIQKSFLPQSADTERVASRIAELVKEYRCCRSDRRRLLVAETLALELWVFNRAGAIRARQPPIDSLEYFSEVGRPLNNLGDDCAECGRRHGVFPLSNGVKICAHCLANRNWRLEEA